jgi:hypothetical protein
MLHLKLMAKPALVALIALAVRACPSTESTTATPSTFRRSVDQTPDPPPIVPSDPPTTPNDPPPVSGGTTPDPSARIPFDGGLSILLTAGAAYGTKKVIDRRKSRKEVAGKE